MGWGESEHTVVGDNKILTVSYGTFSCTLEGFDDPFSVMKAVAEYFRDLTAKDRFFGAEPPQPDPEMLHRIAEQTVDTPVEVQVSDNMMILRNANGDGGSQLVTAPPAAAAVAAAFAPDQAEGAAPLVPAPAPTPADFGQGDSIAEKLQRIRAVVSREVTRPEQSAAAALTAASFSEDQHAEEFVEDEADDMSFAADQSYASGQDHEDEADAVQTADADIDENAPDVSSDAIVDADNEPAAADEDHAVAMQDDGSAEIEAMLEDSPDLDALTFEDDVAEDASVAETAAETVVEETADENTVDEDTTIEAVQEDLAAAEAADEVEAVSEDSVEADAAALADLEAELEAVLDESAAAADDVEEFALDDGAEADVAQDEAQSDEAGVKPRRRIIVQKISREDVEAAQPGAVADVEATTADVESADLSPEAEAALMQELEAVEAEMETAETDTVAKDAVAFTERRSSEQSVVQAAAPSAAKIVSKLRPGETEEQRAARLERRALMVEDEDAALNRLMDATSSKLSDDDEGAVRRASIAHLKAAVAATKADDSIARAAADEEERELDQYRSDLAQVVIPSKSKPLSRETSRDGSQGGEAARSRPLMLVSEQRIDDPVDEPAAATAARDIRPRPATAGNLALQEHVDVDAVADAIAQSDAEDFGSFAAKFGALELPDLLEAAAAHFTYVEGTGSFTRPMLMRKISSISDAENISREAGLRSFGALLREGKLVKGDDGKFVISGSSRFAPEAREGGV